MKASNTLTNWMKAKYGKVPQDLDQHYDDLTKELSSYGPINDVDHAAMVNHVANMETQGRPVQAVKPVVKNPGMQAILAKMQAHGSQLPARVLQNRLPHLQTGGIIPIGGSAVVGDNSADPAAATPEVVTNTPGGAVVQPNANSAPDQSATVSAPSPVPPAVDPNANGAAAQLQAATNVASSITGLSPQAVAQAFNPDQIMALYQKYQDTINSPGRQLGNTLTRFGGMTNSGAAGLNAANASIAADDARTKDSILGPTLAGQQTLADQQNQDRLNAPILAGGAQTVIGLPTVNSTNAVTQLGNAGSMNIMKQAQDPNSPYSQAIVQAATPLLKQLGVTVPDGMNAAQFSAAFGGIPQIAKIIQDYNQAQSTRMEAQASVSRAQSDATNATNNVTRTNADITGKTAAAAADAKATQDAMDESRATLQSVTQTQQDVQRARNLLGQAYQGPGGEWLVNVNGKSQELKGYLSQIGNDLIALNAHNTGGVGELRSAAVALGEKGMVPTLKTFASDSANLLDSVDQKLAQIQNYHLGAYKYVADHKTINGYTPPALPPSTSSIPTFNTEQDAQKANVPNGTRVIIGGKSGVWSQ